MGNPLLHQILKPLSWSNKEARRLYLPVSIFHGTSRIGNQPLSFAYAGNNPITKYYWAEQILGSKWKEENIGRRLSCKIENAIKKEYPDCSMTLMQPGAFLACKLEKKQVFKIPEWIDMEIDISPTMEKLCILSYSGFRDTRRLIRKHGFTYEVTKDQNSFDDFYNNMLIPYVKQRYGGTARIESYSYEKALFAHSDLFIIKKENDIVGGALVEYRDGASFLRKMAVKDGNFEYVKQGVLSAAYYFAVTEMQKKGFTKIHIGGSRPVLSDGVTQLKLRWLGSIIPDYVPFDYTFMTLLNDTPGLEDFLVNNPFIHYTKKMERLCTICIQPHQISGKEAFEKLLRSSNCAGTDGYHIYTFGQGTIPDDWLDTTTFPLSILPATNLFSK